MANGGVPLRVLFVEDDPDDQELCLLELKKAGFEAQADLVQTAGEFRERLRAGGYDVVIADYDLPGWTGMDALEELQQAGHDVPFLLITKQLGEERAVECIKRGAADCVLKDRLVRLPVALRHALDDKRFRKESRISHQALLESEGRYRQLFERNLAGVYRVTLDGGILDCNEACARILGYASRDEILSAHVLDSYDNPADRTRFLERLSRDRALTNYELRLRKRDGSPVWVLENAYLVESFEGGPPVIEGTMVDVTDRKRAQEERALALAREEAARAEARLQARFRQLLEAAPDPILEIDESDTIVVLNAAAERLFGYSRQELLGKQFFRLLSEASREVYARLRAECLAPSRASDGPRELTARRKNGHEVFIEVNLSPLRTDERELISCIIRDITERKHLEEQLRQAQKMEAVGRLAGGVAHDFNNLLTIIGGYSQMLLDGMDGRNPLRRDLEAVMEAANRASSLTRQLLAFSRRQIVQPKVLDLNRLVGRMHKMLRRVIGEDVQLKVVPRRRLPRIKADPGQIEQVIMNLAVNARDAMPRGGLLLIETAEICLGKPEADAPSAPAPAGSDLPPGRYVALTISDTGTGMSEEVRNHIFEPFFTTKGRGQGTGLGLSTVYGIVKQSGGDVLVESREGQGSKFRIYFPALSAEAGPPDFTPRVARFAGGKETVLLVEDEAELRKLAREMLSRQGYRVLEAESSAVALHLWSEHQGSIDVLLTDVVMPQMSGGELAEQLRTFRPDLKVLFMSGYTEEVLARCGVVESEAAFLHKPFTPESLGRQIRKLLDEARSV